MRVSQTSTWCYTLGLHLGLSDTLYSSAALLSPARADNVKCKNETMLPWLLNEAPRARARTGPRAAAVHQAPFKVHLSNQGGA